jgi:hypothetical protein
MDLRSLLRDELARHRRVNPRYSLRAFARRLRTHHTTIGRILDGGHRLTASRVTRLGQRLGLSAPQVSHACLHENMSRVEDIASHKAFRADSRWIAMQTGMPLDDVNVALACLLHARRLSMPSTHNWIKEIPA